MNAIVPAPTFRSPTAVEDESDLLDENIYSAIGMSNGGNGTQRVFTVATGGQIPFLGSNAVAVTGGYQWQLVYSDLTTNLTKPGELGAAIGDGAVRAFGITMEAAGFLPTSATGAAQTPYGMGQYEVAEVLRKVSFEFKLSAKRQIVGPVHTFPGLGGVGGGIAIASTSATAGSTLVSNATNGGLGTGRRLKYPIEVARTDTIEGIFTTGNGSALAFSNGGTAGANPSLVWVNMLCTIAGDVR